MVHLVVNPVYVTMVIGWVFGSYLIGGFGTWLPKYIESQYTQTQSASDVYAGELSSFVLK